jgi:hypothetical protein
MGVAIVVGMVSLIPFAWMVESAISEGFGFFVIPLVILELLFLLAVFCVSRLLALDDDEPEPRYRTGPVRPAGHSARREPERRAWEPTPSTDSRWSSWANWWFNGLRDSHGRRG